MSCRALPNESVFAEHLLRSFQEADIGFALLDCELRYVALNPFLARIHGTSVESHIGARLQDMLGSLLPQVEPAYRQVLATGRPVLQHQVHGAVAPDTEAGHWMDNLFPLKDSRGNIRNVCAIVTRLPGRYEAPSMSASGRAVLRSWKEIADYCGACVKTVQRWEPLQFPVRRLKHAKGSVVFAMRDEVDSWLRAQGRSVPDKEIGPS